MMRSFALFFAATVSAVFFSGHSASAGTVLEGQSLQSTALGRDLTYNVYLPEGHGEEGRRFPTAFLLHGRSAGRDQWLRDGHVAATLDAMIASGELPPMIAVMPDAGNSWYVDSASIGGPGDFETAISRDLVREIDTRFQTLASRDSRAIAGLSMGGFGALRIAFRHPEVFGAVAGMSPAIWKPGGQSWRTGPASMAPEAAAQRFPGTTGTRFDLGVLESQLPFAHVPTVTKLQDPPEILITVGDDDHLGFYDGAVELYLDLRNGGMKPELRVADGGHDWRHWRPMSREVFSFFASLWSGKIGQ